MSFGDNLKKYREKAGLSQSALGAKMGLKGSVIGRYELGEATPKPDRILEFAYALGIDTNTLLGYENREADEIEYAKKYLDNISVQDSFIEVSFARDNGTIDKIPVPKDEFLRIIREVRINTDTVINEANKVNRKSLMQLGFDTKVINKYFFDK